MDFDQWWRGQPTRFTATGFKDDAREIWEAATLAERAACAVACEDVHIRPIQGAHEEYMDGKEMAVMQCARAIRMRSNAQ